MIKSVTEEFITNLLRRVDSRHVKVVIVNGHTFSFREKGKEFGRVGKRESTFKLGATEYKSESEAQAKELYKQVGIHQGILQV